MLFRFLKSKKIKFSISCFSKKLVSHVILIVFIINQVSSSLAMFEPEDTEKIHQEECTFLKGLNHPREPRIIESLFPRLELHSWNTIYGVKPKYLYQMGLITSEPKRDSGCRTQRTISRIILYDMSGPNECSRRSCSRRMCTS